MLYLKVGHDIWVVQLLQDLDLSEGTGTQCLRIFIYVFNLELLDGDDGLGADNSALHDQTCTCSQLLWAVWYSTRLLVKLAPKEVVSVSF